MKSPYRQLPIAVRLPASRRKGGQVSSRIGPSNLLVHDGYGSLPASSVCTTFSFGWLVALQRYPCHSCPCTRKATGAVGCFASHRAGRSRSASTKATLLLILHDWQCPALEGNPLGENPMGAAGHPVSDKGACQAPIRWFIFLGRFPIHFGAIGSLGQAPILLTFAACRKEDDET